MDGAAGEDEKKPFDAEQGADDDIIPDPQEVLFFDHRAPSTKCWMIKMPKHLMERWSAVDTPGQRLANIRVFASASKAIVTVAPQPGALDDEPERFECPILDRPVHNQFVVTNRLREPGNRRSRAYESRVIGRVQHEGQMRAMGLDERQRARIKARTNAAMPARQVVRMDKTILPGGQGEENRLGSGVGNAGAFTDFVKQPKKPAKGQFERMARMPRNQLLDLLFGAFRDQQFWRLQDLRQKTQQPEAYLKEVLSEIATLHRSGDHSSMWELKAGIGFEDPNAQGGSSQTAGLYQMKAEDYAAEDDDDEDEEDEDMEEVT